MATWMILVRNYCTQKTLIAIDPTPSLLHKKWPFKGGNYISRRDQLHLLLFRLKCYYYLKKDCQKVRRNFTSRHGISEYVQ